MTSPHADPVQEFIVDMEDEVVDEQPRRDAARPRIRTALASSSAMLLYNCNMSGMAISRPQASSASGASRHHTAA